MPKWVQIGFCPLKFDPHGNKTIIEFCFVYLQIQQECIPVGCVPAARRPYAGVCFPGGGWGCCVCLVPGGCLPGPGVSAWSGGCLLGPGGSAWSGGPGWSRGVCLVWGGVCLVRGGLASQHALRQTPSPLWTDTHL